MLPRVMQSSEQASGRDSDLTEFNLIEFMPLLSLYITPMQAAVLLLPVYLISDVVGMWLYRRDFSKPHLRVLIPAGPLQLIYRTPY